MYLTNGEINFTDIICKAIIIRYKNYKNLLQELLTYRNL